MAKAMRFNTHLLRVAINRKRFEWVDQVMKEILPTEVYGGMHSDNREDRQKAVNWLSEKGYYVKDAGEGVMQVFKGTRLLRQRLFVWEITDPEELLGIAEAVTDHKNIPPPPWAPK
jgi:hypothetical protein